MSRTSVTTVTVTCDRCMRKAEGGFDGGGTSLRSESSFRFRQDYGRPGGSNVNEYDLCAGCSRGFFEFMRAGPGTCTTATSSGGEGKP